jgi:glycosyltransferase involved in cell wall biosynthesis
MQSTQKKKVLFLITKSNWGGAQRYVYDLATNLDKNQFEAVVALGGDGTLKQLLVHAGIRVIPLHTLERDISIKKELAFIKELWQVLRIEKPDILHVNSSKAGAVGTFLGRLSRVPRVLFTAHGWAFNEDRPVWQKLIIKKIHWLTVLFSHKTIAVSNAIVRQMDWPFAQSKMKVIHPGRSIGVMYEKTEARAQLASENPELQSHVSDPWILTIAELHPIKRLNVLIDAMAHVCMNNDSVRSIIIGEGSQRDVLEAQIKKRNLTKRVFLVGSITEAARFLPAGDLFVLPSKSESYGYVLHEAGLAMLPVIATNVGGIPDVISHNKTGRLIRPDDTDALFREIEHFLQHSDKWQTYARELHAEMKKRTTQKMVDATTAIYTLTI